eukprot:1175693-Prorocentrum_minimum.AAC.3
MCSLLRCRHCGALVVSSNWHSVVVESRNNTGHFCCRPIVDHVALSKDRTPSGVGAVQIGPTGSLQNNWLPLFFGRDRWVADGTIKKSEFSLLQFPKRVALRAVACVNDFGICSISDIVADYQIWYGLDIQRVKSSVQITCIGYQTGRS